VLSVGLHDFSISDAGTTILLPNRSLKRSTADSNRTMSSCLLQCDFTGQTIPAGSTTTFTDLGYDINEFMDEDVKCYNEDFSDLNFEYEVQKVVYSDGTSEEM